MATEKRRRSIFETPLLSTKIKSANVSLFPETALGYLLGPMLALIQNGVLNAFLAQYWHYVLNLGKWGPLFETLIPLVSSIVIIIGNILVGKMMERKPSFAGKARPLILLGLPLIAAALLLMFLIVPYPTGATAANPNVLTLVFITLGYNIYYAFAWPVYFTSHAALVNLSTRDGGKRGLLATAANAGQLGAAGLAGMIGPFIISWLHLLPKDDEIDTATSTSLLSDAELAQMNNKWIYLMLILIGALIIGCLLEYFFTRERISEEHFALSRQENKEQKTEVKKIPMSAQIKICLKDKFWWLIILFYLLYQMGGMFKNNDILWFSQAFTNDTKLGGMISTIGAVPTAVGMVFVWPLAQKFSKSKTIMIGALAASILGSIGFLVLVPAIKDNGASVWAVSIIAFCLKALGTCPAMYISMALMSDVLDHQEAIYGVRTDGFTMAIYGSIMVAMTGITNGIIVGLNNNVSGLLGNQILNTSLFFGGEVLCYFLIFVMFMFMNVEKFSKYDHEAIIADQKAKVLASGGKWIEPEERARLEEEENARLVEEARIEQLKKDCAKKGKNFEEEEANYQKAKSEKEAADAPKKAAAEAKKKEKEEAAKAKEAALPEEVKKARADKEAKVKTEFEAIRAKNAELRTQLSR